MKYIILILTITTLCSCQTLNGYPPWIYSKIEEPTQEEIEIQETRWDRILKIGMTEEEVIKNWGIPAKTKVVTNKVHDKIWTYIPHWKFKNYLYFKNGILIGGDPDPEKLF